MPAVRAAARSSLSGRAPRAAPPPAASAWTCAYASLASKPSTANITAIMSTSAGRICPSAAATSTINRAARFFCASVSASIRLRSTPGVIGVSVAHSRCARNRACSSALRPTPCATCSISRRISASTILPFAAATAPASCSSVWAPWNARDGSSICGLARRNSTTLLPAFGTGPPKRTSGSMPTPEPPSRRAAAIISALPNLGVPHRAIRSSARTVHSVKSATVPVAHSSRAAVAAFPARLTCSGSSAIACGDPPWPGFLPR